MKVLVVGGTGFVGTHLCNELVVKNEVTVVSKYPHKFCAEIDGVTYHYDDWKSLNYKSFLAGKDFDKVLMVGWSDHPRLSNLNLLHSFESNVSPTIQLIDNVINGSFADLYFLSSFGALPSLVGGFSKQCISGYAASKFSVEAHLEAYCNFYNRNATSFRISNPYGLYQDYLGSQGVIPIIIYKALKLQSIQIFNGVEVTKDYIHMANAAKKMVDCISSDNSIGYSLVPITSGQNFSVLDILAHIGLQIPILELVPIEFRSKIINHFQKIENMLSYSIEHKLLKSSVSDIILWIKGEIS